MSGFLKHPPMRTPTVTAIIPTMADSKRHASLLAAIASIKNSTRYPLEIIVVVNGDRRCPSVMQDLASEAALQIVIQEESNLPMARAQGRRRAAGKFFCFLDDDDEILPGGIDLRLRPMLDDESVDVVITNGLRRTTSGDVVNVRNLPRPGDDILSALFNENWLASCGGMFRTGSIEPSAFDVMPRYLEWTWLAFSLCLAKKKMFFVDRPTYRINPTSGSLSSSDEYMLAHGDVLGRMLRAEIPKHIRQRIRVLQTSHDHLLAEHHLRQGNRMRALRAHARCIFSPTGIRYLPFSWRLLV
jgi:glycosyltransferase involved in cell wall biosynthesis